MTRTIKGNFTVKMTPQPWSEGSMEHAFGRFMLDKQYHGELEAASTGQMLSAGNGQKGSSGVYVALEKVTGTLAERAGSFVLYHVGVMNRGVPELSIHVSPDSGTEALEGISGSMTIEIVEGKHAYGFSYALADAK